ncbi:hypothetical protein CY34DRAFT_650858 [Suillus luteus UH-Slu-Lm8-n1]|uniref:Uncharacterized protein n=1 Tax=Suillus luteus UH-Slu-Lm8-n1 TaxID=930992 RepID=A0A0D0BD29_9AGAM|nr:hypothetical protein CY34DRAFT_650858 [Suillus luteus UH-Slu-Lm8-n1]
MKMSTIAVVTCIFVANHSNSCRTIEQDQSIRVGFLTVLHGRFSHSYRTMFWNLNATEQGATGYNIPDASSDSLAMRTSRSSEPCIQCVNPFVYLRHTAGIFLLAVAWNTNRKCHPSMIEILRLMTLQWLDTVTIIHPRWVDAH